MSIKAMKQALEALEGSDSIIWSIRGITPDDICEAIKSLEFEVAKQAEKQKAWKTNDTAYRPGGLPQDFIKHEVENEGDWSEWVNPN